MAHEVFPTALANRAVYMDAAFAALGSYSTAALKGSLNKEPNRVDVGRILSTTESRTAVNDERLKGAAHAVGALA